MSSLIRFVGALCDELHEESDRQKAASEGARGDDVETAIAAGISALVLRQVGNAISAAAKKTFLA